MRKITLLLATLLACLGASSVGAQTNYVTIGGVKVTLESGSLTLSPDNFPAIKSNWGTVSYNADTNTLTLNGATIEITDENEHAIEFNNAPGTLVLRGNNAISAKSTAVLAGSDLTIEGNGILSATLSATSEEDCGIFVALSKSLTIQSCSITANGKWGISGRSGNNESLTINGAKIKATGSTSGENLNGSICDLNSLTLINAAIKSPVGAVWNAEQKAVCDADGNIITTEVTINPREPYAVLEGNTLTFYYDTNKPVEGAFDIPWAESGGTGSPGWTSTTYNTTITTVTFGVSFFNYLDLTNVNKMFYGLSNLKTINNIEYLHTENVTDMSHMFEDCSALETIYCAERANWSTVSRTTNMFYRCSMLKGKCGEETYACNGTDNINGTYARVCTAEQNGYFTSITEKPVPYAVLSSDGTTLTFYYNASKPAGAYEMPSGAYAEPDWTRKKETITTVTFDESFKDYHGLTSTNLMFTQLGNLTTINNIEYLNTENVETMTWMFTNCSNLKTLDLSNFDTGNVTSMGGMFYGCSALETIYCAEGTDWSDPNISTTNMFSGCSNLKGKCSGREPYACNGTDNINGTYAKVCTAEQNGYFTSITETYDAYAVLDGTTLTFYYNADKPADAFDIPWVDFRPRWANTGTITAVTFDESFENYDGLTSTSYMFYRMTELKTIENLQYLNTENVTNMEYMFNYCQALETLDLGNKFNTSEVTNMKYMFDDCTALETLDLGDKFNTSKVTNMHSMFNMCQALKTIDLGDKFNTSKVTDMQFMFSYCTALKTIYCDKNWVEINENPSSLRSTKMFFNCTNLVGAVAYDSEKTDVSMANLEGYFTSITEKPVPYAVLSSDGTTLTFYYNASKPTEGAVYDIPWVGDLPGWTSLSGNSTITTVNFDESFGDYHDLTTAMFMFDNMEALTTINDIKYLNTEKVTNMMGMFAECCNLESLDVSKFNTENVIDMGCMFAGCSKLTNLDVSKFNTEKVTNMAGMFEDCSSLTSLDVSNFNTGLVTSMVDMFYGCAKLSTIYAAQNTYWAEVGDRDYENMFYGCSKLSGKYEDKKFPYNGTCDGTYAQVYWGNTNGGYFTYKGNFTGSVKLNSKGFATYASTYYIDFTNPEGYTAWIITGINGDDITFEQIPNDTERLDKESGVLLMGEPDATIEISFKESDPQYTLITYFTDNLLKGITTPTPIEAGEYYGLSGDQFVPVNAGTIPADKALLPASVVNPTGGTKNLNLVFNGETGIIETRTVNGEQAEGIFNLAGQRLTKPQRGINIVNGKKVFIQR